MGSKTISLSDGAYRILSAVKRPGESFSRVVERTLTKKPLSSFVGAWADIDTDEIKKMIKKDREISAAKRRL
ncbi:MAG: antitoxin VapB family protein [Candidatus Hydrothermarchaeaceae archaeon]